MDTCLTADKSWVKERKETRNEKREKNGSKVFRERECSASEKDRLGEQDNLERRGGAGEKEKKARFNGREKKHEEQKGRSDEVEMYLGV